MKRRDFLQLSVAIPSLLTVFPYLKTGYGDYIKFQVSDNFSDRMGLNKIKAPIKFPVCLGSVHNPYPDSDFAAIEYIGGKDFLVYKDRYDAVIKVLDSMEKQWEDQNVY